MASFEIKQSKNNLKLNSISFFSKLIKKNQSFFDTPKVETPQQVHAYNHSGEGDSAKKFP